MANREFHTKNIKEKAAHLASMFGHGDLPQVNQGLFRIFRNQGWVSSQVAMDQPQEFSIVQEEIHFLSHW